MDGGVEVEFAENTCVSCAFFDEYYQCFYVVINLTVCVFELLSQLSSEEVELEGREGRTFPIGILALAPAFPFPSASSLISIPFFTSWVVYEEKSSMTVPRRSEGTNPFGPRIRPNGLNHAAVDGVPSKTSKGNASPFSTSATI